MVINKDAWPKPWIFELMQKKAKIDTAEMYKVFNMGIGMAVVLPPQDVKKAQLLLNKFHMKSWVIGEVVKGNGEVKLV